MAVYKISSADLRANAAKLTQGLRAGDNFILMHYRQPVGYITSEVPKKLLKEAGVKEKKGFREVGESA
jgi:hypothetical protein